VHWNIWSPSPWMSSTCTRNLVKIVITVLKCMKSRHSSSYCHVCGVSWLIITGSGFYDWVYWHFFTITTNYNSSHIEVLQNYDFSLTNALLIYEWTLFYNFGRTDKRAPSRTVSCYSPVVTGMSLLIFVAAETYSNPWQRFEQRIGCSGNLCLPNRCSAMDAIAPI
jgi:hypothetical protein